MKVYIAVLVLLVALASCDPTRAFPSRVRRQFVFPDDDDDDTFQRPPTSTSRPTPSQTTPAVQPPPPNGGPTTPSPQFRACFTACASTPQYNPVCGTNSVTYDNVGKLNCAQRCGMDVTVSFMGTCQPL